MIVRGGLITDVVNCFAWCSMAVLGYKNSFRWQSYGIFFAFLVSNVVFIYATTWLLRIRPLYKS